jgi:hypothetical protein
LQGIYDLEGTMASTHEDTGYIDEKTITLFLARMSLSASEQGKYLGHEADYLSHVRNLTDIQKGVLTSCNPARINDAALKEQPGVLITSFNIATYTP